MFRKQALNEVRAGPVIRLVQGLAGTRDRPVVRPTSLRGHPHVWVLRRGGRS